MYLTKYIREIIVISSVVLLFVAAGYYSQEYFEVLASLVGTHGKLGMALYVIGATITTIIAPLSFLPVMPIAVTLWGSFITAILSILAWTLGATVAFLLARTYGRPLVLRLIGEKKMTLASRIIPQRNLFWAVVLLRMIAPVDLLSYALGLFAVLPFRSYLFATIIGITPFAFIFAYLAHLSTRLQIFAIGVFAILAITSIPYLKRAYRTHFQGK